MSIGFILQVGIRSILDITKLWYNIVEIRKKIEPTSGKRSLGFILVRLYHLLTRRQKLIFLAIIAIMIVSAILTQITPKAIGWPTDDILSKSGINFQQVKIDFGRKVLAINKPFML